MSITYFQIIKYTRTLVLNRTAIYYNKAYFSDKKKVILDVKTEVKKETCIPAEKHLEKKTPEDVDKIEKNAFDNEAEIMHMILAEKEIDASVRSRLSKECSTLLADKKSCLSSGLNSHSSHYEPCNFGEVNWENYSFSQAIETIKHQQQTTPPVSGICAKTPSGGHKSILAASPGTASSSKSGSGGSGNRLVRGEPGKVVLGFVPEEWLKFFIPKTGVSGFFTLLFTTGTFLVSKEYYILEHDFYGGLSMMILCILTVKYVGPIMKNYLDKEIDDYEKGWQKERVLQKAILDEQIEDELLAQHQFGGQTMLVAAKKENVQLQLEAEFRNRQMHVYNEVKKRLDYHIAIAMAHRRITHKNLVDYVTAEVQKSITPEMQNQLINVSIQSIVAEFEKKDK